VTGYDLFQFRIRSKLRILSAFSRTPLKRRLGHRSAPTHTGSPARIEAHASNVLALYFLASLIGSVPLDYALMLFENICPTAMINACNPAAATNGTGLLIAAHPVAAGILFYYSQSLFNE
jgi:hypothetical protein